MHRWSGCGPTFRSRMVHTADQGLPKAAALPHTRTKDDHLRLPYDKRCDSSRIRSAEHAPRSNRNAYGHKIERLRGSPSGCRHCRRHDHRIRCIPVHGRRLRLKLSGASSGGRYFFRPEIACRALKARGLRNARKWPNADASLPPQRSDQSPGSPSFNSARMSDQCARYVLYYVARRAMASPGCASCIPIWGP